MTLTDDELKELEKHYPDRINEILKRHKLAAKKAIEKEAIRLKIGEVPESG